MSSEPGNPSRAVRGRIVMLVDNGVRGDSRVQKEARSAADAGWEVILLGRSTDGNPDTWSIGEATVRLIPMPAHLSKRPHEFRRAWRRPWAYPPSGIGPYRAQRVAAWQTDIRVRSAAIMVGELAGQSAPGRKLRLRAESLAARGVRTWVSFRRHQLTAATKRRKKLDGPWDRFTMAFWRLTMGDRAWRRLEPKLWEFELAFGPVVDGLKPDIIHANDFYMLGVGARATLRARAEGRRVALVWDAHELVSGLKSRADNVRWLPAHIAHEREYAKFADAAITVSDELADTLQRDHTLAVRPTVVLNAPDVDNTNPAVAPDIRKMCEIGPETPLLVYSGAAAPQRGLDIMVDTLPQMPEVHVALVVALPPSRYVRSLADKAVALGVDDRLHLVPYVPHDQVVTFLSGADAGVIPIHHWPNHEIALITKFFEYAHARLPMIVSDVRTMARTTRELGQGEVFRAEDAEDYVRAVKLLLSDLPRYRAVYDRPGVLENWTWQAQAAVLDDIYRRVGPTRRRRAASHTPDVSVIVPLYNAMPYLTRNIRSLLAQSIGLDRFEVIYADDGSTDESGQRVDSFVRKYPGTFKVIHRAENSGGPAVPANLALAMARGRYVFFLGADDYLGEEALERLVEAADEHGSDVVAARMVGVNGRYVPSEVFTENLPDVAFFESRLPYALSNTKLFRREHIEEHGLRYLEDLSIGSDQPFTLEAMLRAKRITMLSDYDYYFAIRRRDAGNITSRTSHEERLRCTERIMTLVADLVPPGPDRDAIVLRHFRFELFRLLQADLLGLDEGVRQKVVAGVGQLASTYLTDRVATALTVSQRLRFRLAERFSEGEPARMEDLAGVIRQDVGPRHAPFVVEDSTLYLAYDCFRRPGTGLADDVFRITSDLAESIAARMEVRATRWKGDQLEIEIHSAVDLTSFEAGAVGLRIGEAAPTVDLEQLAAGEGVLIRAAIRLDQLMIGVSRHGERRPAWLDLRVDASTGSFPLRRPATVAVVKRTTRRGGRLVRLSVVRDRDGNLVIDYVPVTVHRVAARARRVLRRKGGTS